MNLQSNDFELFGLTRQFSQDRAVLDSCWKEMQRGSHPDKFAAQGAAAQRLAMQWSVRINEAYQRLKDPLQRAAYLCELAGAPVNAHVNTAMPETFLIQQLQWREALDEARDTPALEGLQNDVVETRKQMLNDLARFLDADHNYGAAVSMVRSLMFIEKFSRDLDQRVEAMEDTNN